MNVAPDNITQLKPNEIFVYGSNRASRHGKGAALLAVKKFGAIYGKVGFAGQSYGISTKDEHLRTLPLCEIAKEIQTFIEFVKSNNDKVFLVTQIGCGLAGYSPKDIAPLFFVDKVPENVYLPEAFIKYGN